MRLSVERLRWGLLAGALLLIAVLVVLLSYGRYRAVQAWKQIVKRSGATVSHDTNGVTYSQAIGGKTIFTVHAKRAVPHGEGRYTLEDGYLLLYGRDGHVADRISGSQFEYDEKQGVARAMGPVEMEIEPPVGMKPGPRAIGPEGQKSEGSGAGVQGLGDQGPQVIRVRTSGLTYVKKLGVAATDQDVEIEYAGVRGHAHGAEFDSGQNRVHLLAEVRVEGSLRGARATLTAAKADLSRKENEIVLATPVVRSGERVASAGAAVLHLRNDGSLESLEGSGGVRLQQGTRTVTAATLRAAMTEKSQMRSAELAGGVRLVDRSADRPVNGTAKTVMVGFDAAGYATSAVLEGAVGMSMEDRRGGAEVAREMGADTVTLRMVRVARGTRVSAVEAQGGAWARGDARVKGGKKTTSIAGDDLRMTLAQDPARKDVPERLTGSGHTRIEQRMPDGTVESSTGDSLQAQFLEGARGLEIASAEQTGDVRIKSVSSKPGELPSEAVAERAALDGANDVLTLSGRPKLTQGDTSLTADTVKLTQATGDAVASGSVAGTFVERQGTGSKEQGSGNRDQGARGPGAAVTHAMAAEAVLHKAAGTMELRGTDAAPARMWQGASQVEAANLLLDRGKEAMQAWPERAGGSVRAVLGAGPRARGPEGQGGPEGRPEPRARGPEGQGGRGAEGQGARVVRVTSARLDYSGMARQAVFAGGVVAVGQDGTARGQKAVVFLKQGQEPRAKGEESGPGIREQGAGNREQGAGIRARGPEGQRATGVPDLVGGAVERIVMSGGVKVEQPGRVATGEQLLYTAATGEFVMTGTPGRPPRVVDDKQGTMTGATLLFRSPDSTIVVAGEPAGRRVHTETTVRK